MEKQIGKQSVRFENPPYIVSSAAIVGQKEGEGPYAKFFDEILGDDNQDVRAGKKLRKKFRRWLQTRHCQRQAWKIRI